MFANAIRLEGSRNSQWYASLSTIFGASISQVVTVPTDRPYLIFWEQRQSFSNTCNVAAELRVNGVAVTSDLMCRSLDVTPWRLRRVDLRAYAGQEVTLTFTVPVEVETDPDESALSAWWIDDVAFDVAP